MMLFLPTPMMMRMSVYLTSPVNYKNKRKMDMKEIKKIVILVVLVVKVVIVVEIGYFFLLRTP